ncbi:MAG TPA: M3 family metallopeptidase [Acidobacteriota bacterium]|nr:M3 family metallopeptidase [Acidobacteriota bacterium]
MATAKPAPAAAQTQQAAANPLLAKWTGPYGGVPPFDKVKVSDFKPALEAAMDENLHEVDAIANNAAPPNFKNTIEALEHAGATFNRVGSVYGIWSSTMNTGDFQPVQKEMDPKIAAFNDKITQNEKLFKRIEAVYNSPEKASLTPEQQRLTWVYYDNFVRYGAKLDATAKARVAEINQRLATLFTSFSQNLLADESGYVLYLKESDLAGLPQSVKDAAGSAAEEKGHKGEWAILNTRSSMEPFLTYSDRRDLREKVWRTYYNRGDNGDEHDNNKIITEILQLRAERAKLFGFPTHAHWRVSNQMAKTPENAMNLMMQVWPAAVARVHEEVKDMQAIADKEGAGIKIAPWDYRYYAEKVRKAKYDLDMNEVRPYLQLEKMREAVFWAAGQLYGFKFTEIHGVPTVTPDIRVWEVTDAQGKHVGLWYFDPYARTGKQSGAWMNEYRPQQGLENVHAIVSNNTNFIKGKPDEPILISWIDATTLFHEFGHALHGLNSNVMYPTLAGTNVPRDFVEFPSQMNENFLSTDEVLTRFAVHYQTGKPIPKELVDKIEKAATFNQGFQVTEYLAGALVDMKLHLSTAATIDPDAFEKDALKELGMPEEIVMRHRTPQFAHIFSSDGYSAGYYSYLWSEVLDHDAFDAFLETGNAFDPATAKRYHDDIMSVGNTVDPAQAYRNFRGRDPKIDAYLKAKGFPVPAAASAGATPKQ